MNKSYRLLILFFFLIGLFDLNDVMAQNNFWEQVNGPFGGSITAITITPQNELFAGTDGGGVYRSTNWGDNWIECNVGLNSRRVLSIASDAKGNIFCGTDGLGSIYRLINNSDHWEMLMSLSSSLRVVTILCHPNEYILIGIDGRGVMRSSDDGMTWLATNSGLVPSYLAYYIFSLTIKQNGDIFACTDGGVFLSSDNGDHWINKSVLIPTNHTFSMAINSKGQLLVGTWGEGLWISSDNGENWSKLNAYIGGLHIYTVKLKDDAHIFIGSDVGIYRSADGGISWDKVNNGLNFISTPSLLILPQKHLIYAGNSSGIYRSSNDAATWIKKISGITNLRVKLISVGPENILIAVGEDNTIYLSKDKGNNWVQKIIPTLATVNAAAMRINHHIFIATADGLWDSIDEGARWYLTAYGKTNVTTMTLGNKGNIYLYYNIPRRAPLISFASSTDEGETWKEPIASPQIIPTCMTVDSAENIYLGSTWFGIYKSTDNGSKFLNIGMTQTTIMSIAFSKKGNVFSVNNGGGGPYGGIWEYRGGSSWSRSGTIENINEDDVTSILTNPIGILYTSVKSKGVYSSRDEGFRWEPKNSGLTNLDVFSLAIDSTGVLYAGTANGIYRSVLSTNDVYHLEQPSSVHLSQNYPNPFSSTTSIKFQLPTPTYVSLRIFNALGVEIKTVIENQQYDAGTYSIEFDILATASLRRTSDFGPRSGIYFYQLVTPEFSQTKKMVVLR